MARVRSRSAGEGGRRRRRPPEPAKATRGGPGRPEWGPRARLVTWDADGTGYAVRVLDRHGSVLHQAEARVGRGPGANPDDLDLPPGISPGQVAGLALEAAAGLAREIGVAFVSRGGFRLPWEAGGEDPGEGPTGPEIYVGSADERESLARRGAPAGSLLYATVEGSLVFVEERRAFKLADCHRSWRPGVTWGEIEVQIAPGDYASLRALCEGEPGADAEIVGDDFDPYSDGSWPGHPTQAMLDWVPDDLVRAFGEVGESFTTGPCLTLDPRRELEIVAGLERRGYACTWDDLIVRRACRYGY